MAKTAVEEPSRIDVLEKEVEVLRKREALHRRYGANLTDEQIAFYEQVEAREAARKEKHAQNLIRQAEEEKRREAERKKHTLKLVEDGTIVLYANKKRVQPIAPNLAVSCPHCGKPLAEATENLSVMAGRVIDATIPGMPDQLYEVAAQGTSRYISCHACNRIVHLLVQIRP